MKQFCILPILLLTVFATNAQSTKQPSPVDCLNGFSHYQLLPGKEDSAIYFMNTLGKMEGEEPRFNRLVHNIFAQCFIHLTQAEVDAWTIEGLDSARKRMIVDEGQRRYAQAKVLLARIMEDTSQLLVTAVTPVSYWVNTGNEAGHPLKQRALMNAYLKKYLAVTPSPVTETYTTKLRYAFLMQQFIAKAPSLQRYADSVLAVLGKKTEAAYTKLTAGGVNGVRALTTKAQLKWQIGYYNVATGRQLLQKGNATAAGPYFKKAAFMSPDVDDQHNPDGYGVDMFLLFHEPHDSFLPEYMSYLRKHSKGADNDVLTALLEMAMNNINYKSELQKFYISHRDTAAFSFDDYWHAQLNSRWKPIEGFALTKLDSTVFDLSQQKGKWVLLDFWGTWCAPCREEHPALEQFYKGLDKNIQVLTIACRDREAGVRKYMETNNYTFPVAMSDTGVELLYKISVYPTKILVTPEGKYVVVPSEGDWVRFIRECMGN